MITAKKPVINPSTEDSQFACNRSQSSFLKQPTEYFQAEDILFDTTEAAVFVGVKTGTLEIWSSTGRGGIPYIKVGRLVKYRKSALIAFLDEQTRTQTA